MAYPSFLSALPAYSDTRLKEILIQAIKQGAFVLAQSIKDEQNKRKEVK